MPVQFLSPEWTEELEKRLNASDTFRAAASSANALNSSALPAGSRKNIVHCSPG